MLADSRRVSIVQQKTVPRKKFQVKPPLASPPSPRPYPQTFDGDPPAADFFPLFHRSFALGRGDTVARPLSAIKNVSISGRIQCFAEAPPRRGQGHDAARIWNVLKGVVKNNAGHRGPALFPRPVDGSYASIGDLRGARNLID